VSQKNGPTFNLKDQRDLTFSLPSLNTTQNCNMADSTVVNLDGTPVTSPPVAQTPEMEVVNVAAEGDVIFNFEITRLRVLSVILASASPVFKVMLVLPSTKGKISAVLSVRSRSHWKMTVVQ